MLDQRRQIERQGRVVVDQVVTGNRGVWAVCPLETGSTGHLPNDALIVG
jgi:hypothetical protein